MGGLRRHITAVVLAGGLIPLLLAGIATVIRTESDLYENILASHCRQIRQVRLDLESEFTWYRHQLQRLVEHSKVQSLDPAAMHQSLELFLAFHPIYSEVSVYDRNASYITTQRHGGRPHVRVQEPPEAVKKAIVEAIATGGGSQVLSGSAHDHNLELHVIAPIPSLRSDGSLIGAAVATMRRRAAEFQDLVEDMHYVGHTYVYITDANGEVLANSGEPLERNVRRIRVVPDGAVTATDDGIVSGTATVLGRKDVVATATLPDQGLAVVVGRPYAEVATSLRSLVLSVTVYVFIGLMLALLLGIVLSRSLARPILALADGIHRLARGELAHRLPENGADELTQAARSFNELANHLQKGRLLEELWISSRRPPSGGKLQ